MGLMTSKRNYAAAGAKCQSKSTSGSFLASSEARLFYALLEIKANGNNRPALRRIEKSCSTY